MYTREMHVAQAAPGTPRAGMPRWPWINAQFPIAGYVGLVPFSRQIIFDGPDEIFFIFNDQDALRQESSTE